MTTYDQGFYDVIRSGVISSAQRIVPTLCHHFKPTTMIDVGCGEGWWAHEFATWYQCHVLGIDHDANTSRSGIPSLCIDLAHRLPSDLGKFDLALSLEVAEHLPAERADSFVVDLCQLSDVVVFSAAIPGQGGHGHVNEQWPQYWAELFGYQGYSCSGAMRFAFWEEPRIENWYAQNILVAARYPERYPAVFDTPLAKVWNLVHPVLYNAQRS